MFPWRKYSVMLWISHPFPFPPRMEEHQRCPGCCRGRNQLLELQHPLSCFISLPKFLLCSFFVRQLSFPSLAPSRQLKFRDKGDKTPLFWALNGIFLTRHTSAATPAPASSLLVTNPHPLAELYYFHGFWELKSNLWIEIEAAFLVDSSV